MSKRLQVLFPEDQYEKLVRAAHREGATVSDWVRRAVAVACREEPRRSVEEKLAAIRRAARHEGPTGDIEQILAEIEDGYAGEGGG